MNVNEPKGVQNVPDADANANGFIGRQIFDHKNNKFNRECVVVHIAVARTR